VKLPPLLLLATALIGLSGVSAAENSAAAPSADVVLHRGKIWTVNKAQPQAEALAVWQGRILAVGSDKDVRRLIGPATKVIDLQGRRVVPGFHDSHVHFLSSGLRLGQVALKDAADEADFGRRLQEFDRKLLPGRWILGGDWDHDRTFAGKLPTAEVIDRYVRDRPVYIHRYDGHMAVVNTSTLKMAGITAALADPEGGVIVRKPGSKEPSGVLRDQAMSLVSALVPQPSAAEILEGVQAALAEAARCGVTSVQDMDGSPPAVRRTLLRVLQQLGRSGKLTCRVRLYFPLASWHSLAEVAVQVGFGDDWVTIGSLKDFIDGSIGSSTAKMYEPYLHEPGSTGIFLARLSRLREDVIGADAAGLGVAVHAIGDRGNAELLDIFAQAIQKNGPRDRRFRIEHAQHLRPQDFRKFAELGVVASMQPFHAIDDGRWVEGRIGKKRCETSYALRSFVDAGVKVAFGSDWNVAPLDALLGIDAAVNRRTLDGKHPDGWFPEQRISVEQALEGYTLGSAYAAFQEKDRGSLEPGKLADLVVLSRDILAPAERDHIAETRVVMTMVGGRIVYKDPKAR
jgi:predicted amidohydrolase YtcJ